MITYSEDIRSFFLETAHTSYVIRILENGTVSHSYYGAAIPREDLSYRAPDRPVGFSAVHRIGEAEISPESLKFEYPTFGEGDYRMPAAVVRGTDGTDVNALRYHSHRILSGKPRMEGMPQMDAGTEALQTLELVLRDPVSGFEAVLYYTPLDASDVIARRVMIRSIADAPIRVCRAFSASLELEDADYEMISLHGSWARERYVERYPLHRGISTISSNRGASSHQLNPFAAFVEPHTTENSGPAYGVSLVYSGDFSISAEVDPFGVTRVQAGLNPETFSWTLNPGETLELPEALLTYSEDGLNGMSQNFHRACRNHLGRCADRSIRHPIVLNSWEAMYFDFDARKMTCFIRDCAGLGIDTVVMDDGWFGHRDDDTSSLGDWFLDDKKFPDGLAEIVDACHENGMHFGIWFEPEMISRDSRLYEAHPDWCIQVPGRSGVEGRSQLVLDLSRPEVVDCIYEQMAAILGSYDISYVKWDMNRHITDNGSLALPADRQGELSYRYIRGVYALISRLEQRFPKVFFEGCSGGGGRFDFGMLYYMSQIWTSDDTDAVERQKIQYGTSFCYPPSAMVAHVSDCPNHQTGRTTSFETRGNVAQGFSFGYELDAGRLSGEDREAIRAQIRRHRELEPLVNFGTFYRLRSPFTSDCCSWELVAEDRSRAFVLFGWRTAFVQPKPQLLKLRGLDPYRQYRIEQLGIVRSGATLMRAGVLLTEPPRTDYPTLTLDLIAE